MVITSTTGNRVAANTARGFESLLLRHKNNHTFRCGYFYGYREDFTCPAEVNSACTKVLAFGQNACTRLTARPAVRGPGQCAASLLVSRVPFVTITPDGCYESRVLHIAFPFCSAKWEPFHLTCAAEMNSALRQS